MSLAERQQRYREAKLKWLQQMHQKEPKNENWLARIAELTSYRVIRLVKGFCDRFSKQLKPRFE